MEINSLTFSSSDNSLAVSLSAGFAVYSLSPPSLINRSNFQGQPTNHCAASPKSHVVVFCGLQTSGAHNSLSSRSLCAFDYQAQAATLDIECNESITKIVVLDHYFAALFPNELKVYKFDPPSLVQTIRFATNENSPCDIIETEPNVQNPISALPKIRIAVGGQENSGQVKITSYQPPQQQTNKEKSTNYDNYYYNLNVNANTSTDQDIVIDAANHPISLVKFNKDASLLATSSIHGTLIRIFETKTGRQVNELRRGSFSANIFSVSFSLNSDLVACLSSNGTIHIFDMKIDTTRSQISAKIDKVEGILTFLEDGKIALATKNGVLKVLKWNREANTIETDGEIKLEI